MSSSEISRRNISYPLENREFRNYRNNSYNLN